MPLAVTMAVTMQQNNNAYHKINNAIHIVIHHSGTHPLLLLIPPILVSLRELVRVVVLIPLVSYIVVTTLVVFIVIQNRHLCGARFISTFLERVAIVSSGSDVAIFRNKCQHIGRPWSAKVGVADNCVGGTQIGISDNAISDKLKPSPFHP